MAIWKLLFTKSRKEFQAERELQDLGIVCYMPKIRVLRQWSDRVKSLTLPAFPSYIFVCVDAKNRNAVFGANGISHYVRVGQDDAVVAEDIIHQVKQMERGMSPEVTYRLEIGSKVAITSGVFSGYRARTLEVMGRRRIKLELEGLQNLRVIEMPVSQVMAY